MLTFKKLRRLVLISGLLSCGAYVYFLAPTIHNGDIPMGVQPLGPVVNSFETRSEPLTYAGFPVEAFAANAIDAPRPDDQTSRLKTKLRQVAQQTVASVKTSPSPHGSNEGRGGEDEGMPSAEGLDRAARPGRPNKEPTNPERPWFFQNGSKRPLPGERGNLWPHEDPDSDRIVEQLMFMPLNSSSPMKKIYLQRGSWGGLPLGQSLFLRDNCPVNRCTLTDNAEKADALVFKDRYVQPPGRRHPDQVYILYLLECPMHTPGFRDLGPVFNWTATYRHDSDLVAPYEKWVPYPDATEDPSLEELPPTNFDKRTKDVAWFVSNCNARNGRLQFARKLGAHIGVDVYGACSNKKCPRYNKSCFEMLDTTYKFYLAFENSNCKDYITEKFFVNGLNHTVVPIVMGARKSEYVRAAPANSFIHVDDFNSAKELADYLREISRSRERWESFLQSRRRGEMINTYFFCRLCAMLHDDIPRKVYPDIHAWWAGSDVCTSRKWKPEPKQAGREPAYRFL